MGRTMTKQETLYTLRAVYEKIDSMSEEELFEYMMENSETFKRDVISAEDMDNSRDDYFIYLEDVLDISNIKGSFEIIETNYEITIKNEYKGEDEWTPTLMVA